ncbi:hypothetical protein LCGC14_1082550 [marine sediment metagenome]|uniref:Uncharacterized protein n=1 Tax=marine sediment metagenome TaxID=412755 RepID=A0A0F9PY20_9ZZZZ
MKISEDEERKKTHWLRDMGLHETCHFISSDYCVVFYFLIGRR